MCKININDILRLRERTGFGIIDCKKALIAMKGNFEKSIDLLRKTNKNKIYNASERSIKQGAITCKVNSNNKKGIIIGINCETDFVAKNFFFLKLLSEVVEIALNCDNKDQILFFSIKNRRIKDIIYEHMLIIGEKLSFSIFETLESYFVASYTHHGNKIASLIGFSVTLSGINIIGKELAMQIVAMKPIALNMETIPSNILKKEIEIIKVQELGLKKSEDILEKIVQGKLKKFICENTLLSQKYIKNQKITVQNYLYNFNKNIFITKYKCITL